MIYLDTNVYSRPFDDQTQPKIQAEANTFLDIVPQLEAGDLTLLCSDMLVFEVENILSTEKRTKVEDYELCAQHVGSSEAVLELGKQIQSNCQIRPRDALHVASAILGGARYLLSCDKTVTQMKQARRYRREYFSVMNPIRFVDKMKRRKFE